MTAVEFNDSVCKQLDYCKSLLVRKGAEYAPDSSDRLGSFKVAGALQNVSDKEAACGMLAKHIVSVYEMCRSTEQHSLEKWTEKITDSINYLLILKAMVDDENK